MQLGSLLEAKKYLRIFSLRLWPVKFRFYLNSTKKEFNVKINQFAAYNTSRENQTIINCTMTYMTCEFTFTVSWLTSCFQTLLLHFEYYDVIWLYRKMAVSCQGNGLTVILRNFYLSEKKKKRKCVLPLKPVCYQLQVKMKGLRLWLALYI